MSKNDFGERLSLFRRCFIRMDLGNVDTREVQLFVRTTLKYVVRKTDQHFYMRKVYCEPDFAKLSRDLGILVINRQEIDQ